MTMLPLEPETLVGSMVATSLRQRLQADHLSGWSLPQRSRHQLDTEPLPRLQPPPRRTTEQQHRKALTVCTHSPACADADDIRCCTAHVIADHHDQGWCLLCNGLILFDDGYCLRPTGQVMTVPCVA
jgi:Family of unknown function (DUF5999)